MSVAHIFDHFQDLLCHWLRKHSIHQLIYPGVPIYIRDAPTQQNVCVKVLFERDLGFHGIRFISRRYMKRTRQIQGHVEGLYVRSLHHITFGYHGHSLLRLAWLH